MQVKTFRADSLNDALFMVKRDLGDEAVILSTGTVRENSRYGFAGKKLVEVTAAVEGEEETEEAPAPRKHVRAVVDDERSPNLAHPSMQRSTSLMERLFGWGRERGERAVAAESAAAQPLPEETLKKVISPLQDELEEIRRRMEVQAKQRAVEAEKNTFDGSLEVESLRGELREMRGLLDHLVTRIQSRELEDLGEAWEKVLEAARRNGVSEKVPVEILQSMRERGEIEYGGRLTVEEIKAAFVRRIPQTKAIETIAGAPKVVALVGPTGVGKTTTLAKMASLWALKEKKKVAVLAADSFRIGAFWQLSTYAKILGVPCEEVKPSSNIDDYIKVYRDYDLILVDTFGVSPTDTEKIQTLKTFFEISKHPIETHLVLSANARSEDLNAIVTAMEGIHPKRVIFTKLDETNHFGGIFDVLYRTQKPLSYVGLGQRVPEDIGEMSAKQVVDFVLK